MNETFPSTVDQIVEKCHEAYEKAQFVAPHVRFIWLNAIADALEAARTELIPLAVAETSLADGRLNVELTRTIFQLRLLGEEIELGDFMDATIDHADPNWGMGPRPDIRRMNHPVGVVAVFGASNFPFAFSVAGGDTAFALAAGCGVVHKAHSAHAALAERTSQVVISALRSAGAPDGLFALVAGRDAGIALVEHPLVQAVGFTGSAAGGRALFDRAMSRPQPIPFYGELGSTNPVFVTRAAWNARHDEIIKGYVASVALGMGQFCTKPGFIVIPDGHGLLAEDVHKRAVTASRTDMLSRRVSRSSRH